jgi:hypothetical protein
MKFRVLGTLKARDLAHVVLDGMIYPGVYDAGVAEFPAELKDVLLREVSAESGMVEVLPESVMETFLKEDPVPEPETKEPEELAEETETEKPEAKSIIKKVVRKKKA